ncbi:MAG: PD-(D/E)XK nuclease family protein [Candidatus Wildermuthbacteria bacterium]|nr:PD-(D/E)XK nuclease family protein [Candidatus Wildermuthbacteria bacterium]
MSQYYTGKRTRNIFDPSSGEPFALSRSRLENFMKCRRCFYLDRRLGVDQPPGFPFSLNSAVDALLKKEFDVHRAAQSRHPLVQTYGIDAVPFAHAMMNVWRDPFKGVQYLHQTTNFLVTGGVDDLWQNSAGELHVVDYKATAKNGEVNIDAEWQGGYKRQIEIYQWLFRQNGFKISDIGYFVYVNGRTDKEAFDGKLEFDVKIIPYKGDDSWVEQTLKDAKACLVSNTLPDPDPSCDFCIYRSAVARAENPRA